MTDQMIKFKFKHLILRKINLSQHYEDPNPVEGSRQHKLTHNFSCDAYDEENICTLFNSNVFCVEVKQHHVSNCQKRQRGQKEGKWGWKGN